MATPFTTCKSLNVKPDFYVNQMNIGFNTDFGITQLQIYSTDGQSLNAGKFSPINNNQKVTFTKTSQLFGLYGMTSGSTIT